MFIRTKFHINRLTQTYFTAFLYVLSDHPSYNDMSDDFCTYNWLRCIKDILDGVSLTYIWDDQGADAISVNWLSKYVRDILEAQFKQQWHSGILF